MGFPSQTVVSVCLPTYNNASYIKEAIQSAINQNINAMEIIVSDNASTDNTKEIVTNISSPLIRYNRNNENIGMCANFRKALSLAKGRYVLFLSGDDMISDNRLCVLINALESQNNAVFAFGNTEYIGGRLGRSNYKLDRCSEGRVLTVKSLRDVKNYVFLVSALFKREAASEVMIEDMVFFDWLFWLRLAMKGNVVFCDDVVGLHRYHDRNETKLSAGGIKKECAELMRVPDRFIKNIEQNDAVLIRAAKNCRNGLFMKYLCLAAEQKKEKKKNISDMLSIDIDKFLWLQGLLKLPYYYIKPYLASLKGYLE